MALQTTTRNRDIPVANRRPEGELLQRMLSLYAEEEEIYQRVLALSRQQGEIVRQRGSLGEVRRVLQQKKNCLELIGRLELMEKGNKRAWQQRRQTFSRDSRQRLQSSLNAVTSLIEEILTCEEQNDLYLIEQARTIS